MSGTHVRANGLSLYVEVTEPTETSTRTPNGTATQPQPQPQPQPASTVLVISGTGNNLRADVLADGSRAVHPLVTAGFRVIQYDQRGLGQSDKPDRPYTMAEYGDDAAAVLDALEVSRCHVVGISFGGMVAQHLAIRHPNRIERLVLCCTSSGGAGGSSFDLLAIEALPEDQRIRIAASVMDTRNDLSVTPPVFAPGYLPVAKRAARSRQLQAAEPNGAMGARRQLEARAHHNTWADLVNVHVPTLVCGGVFDAQAPPENVRALSNRIPSATLHMFEGGHAFLFQDPTAWPAIADFLNAAA
jgi:3-oxoadipate enol-lactonase